MTQKGSYRYQNLVNIVYGKIIPVSIFEVFPETGTQSLASNEMRWMPRGVYMKQWER